MRKIARNAEPNIAVLIVTREIYESSKFYFATICRSLGLSENQSAYKWRYIMNYNDIYVNQLYSA